MRWRTLHLPAYDKPQPEKPKPDLNPNRAPGASGAPSRPTDQTVIAELPRLRIEPYVQLLVRSGAATTAAAAATAATAAATAVADGATAAAPPPLLQLQGTGSSFGTPLSDVRGSLVLSEPLDGSADLLGEYKVPPSADPIPDPKPDPKPDPEPDPKPEPTSNYNQASRPG